MRKRPTVLACLAFAGGVATAALTSIDTGYTISKVRAACHDGQSTIVASSYEGTLLAVKHDGTVLWKHALSGFMNRDLWCADLDADGSDEILAANADGTVYCLDNRGELLWQFKGTDAPMNAVCGVHGTNRTPLVACGGYEKNIFYLSSAGELLATIPSSTYSKEKSWGKSYKRIPARFQHIANFLRPLRRADGSEALALHAAIYSNSGRGSLYLFEPLAEQPYKVVKVTEGGVGELRVCDVDGDGNDDVLTGSSSMINDARFLGIDLESEKTDAFAPSVLRRKIDGFGYRVLQPAVVKDGLKDRFLLLFGARLILLPLDLAVDPKTVEVLSCRYSFNDMWTDGNKIILASAQSGGSCIHVLDLSQPGWKQAYESLEPPGKIAAIVENTSRAREQLKSFKRPAWEREPVPVYFMTDGKKGPAGDLIERIESEYESPVFLNSTWLGSVENLDRSNMNPVYRKKRDGRAKYTQTSEQMVNKLLPLFDGHPGIAYWGGHGNDPFMLGLKTQKRIFDGAKGKKTVTIYPELEAYDENFAWVMENHFYPMARYAQGRNANIFVRTKHAFWHSIVYLPFWRRLVSGEFADVFVPALEETTDKTMEQSVAARLGIWASGAVNQWGARCARDNTSFDRLRQHSHQELPNHFLRQMVYNISCGATYLNNFPVDQEYMSLLWELIARGALYVPKRSELVSLSPVHISMTEPDPHFLDTGNNAKWLTFFDEEEERGNPMVFGRLNGTWPGAPVTEWDFSRYAAGVRDRRLNYLPPYENGIVMLTPPQAGKFADPDAPRGKMIDHLHPLYRNVMKEFISDGRQYYSADGKETYPAKEYHRVIETEIRKRAERLPLTVSGGVAWVAAQTAPNHLRLTLVDSGYINPKARVAKVHFHAVRPVRMADVLSGESLDISEPSAVAVNVPLGLFRFIDIEFKGELVLTDLPESAGTAPRRHRPVLTAPAARQ